MRDWINIAYLRVFLLVLDAYLIVSRFYSACRNFCALWLGKRRRVYHNTRNRAGQAGSNLELPGGKRLPLNEHANEAMLLTSSDIEQSRTTNEQTPDNDVSISLFIRDDILFWIFRCSYILCH